MKKVSFLFFILCNLAAIAQTGHSEISVMESSLNDVQLKQVEIEKEIEQLSVSLYESKNRIQTLEQCNKVLCNRVDSLKTICSSLKKVQESDRKAIIGKIQETNDTVASNLTKVESRTLLGWIVVSVILAVLLTVFYYLTKRIKKEKYSIDEVRKVQNALQAAQTKIQEESVKLDNNMIELFDKQIQSVPTIAATTPTDHSLALKVADEIVRIEMNLSRMDTAIKGYKQLAKAVQRIKDNFNANGYEIVDMLGKPYNTGMKAVVTFVTDENLEQGQQIITKIIKPQINYQQQMIQAAQIEVSQSE